MAAACAAGVLGSSTAGAAPCAGFTDVEDTSEFCPNVEWLKNRAITLGCSSTTLYCPTDPVSRLAMAAFMNRLGTALTPVQVRAEASTGPLDLDASPVVCATSEFATTGFPRRAFVDAGLSATATADAGMAADLVMSTDAGVTWVAMNTLPNRGSVTANQWAGVSDIAYADLAVGQAVRWGLRVSRGGIAGSADLTDARCQLRSLVYSRDGAASPF